MAKTDAPPSPVEPDASEASLEVDGQAWVVRVLGRAGGSGSGATPLIMLGFWKAGATEGGPVRETLAVGRALSAFSVSSLERALSRSQPYAPDGLAVRSPDASEPRSQ